MTWKHERHAPALRARVFSILLFAIAAQFTLAAPFFQGLGDLPDGLSYSRAYAVSADGYVVVGQSGSASGAEAFRWTQAGGVVGIGDLAGGAFGSTAWAVSSDGTVVAGVGSSSGQEGFRWTQAGGMVGLGFLIGDVWSPARGVSADGSVVVGQCDASSTRQAYRWTQAGGMISLGGLEAGLDSWAGGVSSDGSVVVGSGNSAPGRQAFRWTQATGMVGLGDLPGGIFFSYANGVSSDGSVVGGYSGSASGTEAFRWTQPGGIVGLGDLPGGIFSSFAYSVSSDGSVVVGYGTSASGSEAFRWTQADGMRRVYDVLVNDYGVSLPGWTLGFGQGVSGDGKVIVGYGTNPSGQQEAWIASLRVATLSSTPGNGGTLSFGNVLVGNPATQSLSVTNTGDPGSALLGTFPAGTSEFTPGGTQSFGPVAQGAGTSRNYTYAPAARGSDSLDVTVLSDGGILGENSTITLSGTGVAPVQSVQATPAIVYARLGTVGTGTVTIRNVGNGNLATGGASPLSNLNGTLAAIAENGFSGAGGTFSLPDGAEFSCDYSYDPVGNRIPASGEEECAFSNGSSDERNLAQTLMLVLTGQGVGPIFDSSVAPGSTIDFGAIILGGNALRQLRVGNASADPNGGNASLTNLTLLAADITGPDASLFSLIGFTPGMVQGEGVESFFDISFSALGPVGGKSATLTFLTDQGTAFGEDGATFSFYLTGDVAIPEPATLSLLALGGLAALARRRRSQRT